MQLWSWTGEQTARFTVLNGFIEVVGLRWYQLVGETANLIRCAVVDPQNRRAASDVDAQATETIAAGIDSLSGVTKQHQVFRSLVCQCRQQPEFLRLQVLNLIDNDGVKRTFKLTTFE